jgi:hypothetical protein
MTIAVEERTKPGRGDESDERREAEDAMPTQRQERSRQTDLGRAEPEDRAAKTPQSRGLHFQADDEEEHHHAEFGDMQDRFGIGEQPEPEWADDQSRGESSPAPSRARYA